MLKRLFILFASFFLLFSLLFFLSTLYWRMPIEPQSPAITIEKGATLRSIAQELESKGILRHGWTFILYAHLLGKGSQIKAGDYLFKEKVAPKDVLDKLVKGIVVLNKVPIIEGWTVRQIAASFDQLGFIKDPGFAEEFLRLASNPPVEGYLIPDTYSFPKEAKPEDFLKAFLGASQNFYEEILLALPTPPAYSRHEIVTLASMIEKETGKEEERALIASVFYNRLKKKMPLASDPTVIYGIKNFSGNLTKADLNHPHPYNTYIRTGLPPGPICNPGRASILAALKPAQTDYLYFVSKGDGTHHFSKTATEHARAVQQYQVDPLPFKSP